MHRCELSALPSTAKAPLHDAFLRLEVRAAGGVASGNIYFPGTAGGIASGSIYQPGAPTLPLLVAVRVMLRSSFCYAHVKSDVAQAC